MTLQSRASLPPLQIAPTGTMLASRIAVARPALLCRALSNGGAIRGGGGKFGEREKAQEDQYFRKKVCPPRSHRTAAAAYPGASCCRKGRRWQSTRRSWRRRRKRRPLLAARVSHPRRASEHSKHARCRLDLQVRKRGMTRRSVQIKVGVLRVLHAMRKPRAHMVRSPTCQAAHRAAAQDGRLATLELPFVAVPHRQAPTAKWRQWPPLKKAEDARALSRTLLLPRAHALLGG